MAVRVELLKMYRKMPASDFEKYPYLQELTEQELALLPRRHQEAYLRRRELEEMKGQPKKNKQAEASSVPEDKPVAEEQPAEAPQEEESKPSDVSKKGLEIERNEDEGKVTYHMNLNDSEEIWWNKNSMLFHDKESDVDIGLLFDKDGVITDVTLQGEKLHGNQFTKYMALVAEDVSSLSGNFVRELVNYARNDGHWNAPEGKTQEAAQKSQDEPVRLDATKNGAEIEVGADGSYEIDFSGDSDIVWNKDSIEWNSPDKNGENQKITINFDAEGNVASILLDNKKLGGVVAQQLLARAMGDISIYTGNSLNDLVAYARNGGHWNEGQEAQQKPQEAQPSVVTSSDDKTKWGDKIEKKYDESHKLKGYAIDFVESKIYWDKNSITYNPAEGDSVIRVEFNDKGEVQRFFWGDEEQKLTDVNSLGYVMAAVQKDTGHSAQELINYARNGGHWNEGQEAQQQAAPQQETAEPEQEAAPAKEKGAWGKLMDQYKIEFTDDEKEQIQSFADCLKNGKTGSEAFDAVHAWKNGIFTHAATKNMGFGFIKQGKDFKFRMPEHMTNPDEIDAFASAMFVFNKYKDMLPTAPDVPSHRLKETQRAQLEACLQMAQDEQNPQQQQQQPVEENQGQQDQIDDQIVDVEGNKTRIYYPYAKRIMTVETSDTDKNIKLYTIVDLVNKEQVEFMTGKNKLVTKDYSNGSANGRAIKLTDKEVAKYESILNRRVEEERLKRAGKTEKANSSEGPSESAESPANEEQQAAAEGLEKVEAPAKKGWWRRFKDWLKRLFRRRSDKTDADATEVPADESESSGADEAEDTREEEATIGHEEHEEGRPEEEAERGSEASTGAESDSSELEDLPEDDRPAAPRTEAEAGRGEAPTGAESDDSELEDLPEGARNPAAPRTGAAPAPEAGRTETPSGIGGSYVPSTAENSGNTGAGKPRDLSFLRKRGTEGITYSLNDDDEATKTPTRGLRDTMADLEDAELEDLPEDTETKGPETKGPAPAKKGRMSKSALSKEEKAALREKFEKMGAEAEPAEKSTANRPPVRHNSSYAEYLDENHPQKKDPYTLGVKEAALEQQARGGWSHTSWGKEQNVNLDAMSDDEQIEFYRGRGAVMANEQLSDKQKRLLNRLGTLERRAGHAALGMQGRPSDKGGDDR